MKNFLAVFLFILTACIIYIYRSRNMPPNMDDRVAIVIALGKFPPLADENLHRYPPLEYISIMEYKKYSPADIDVRNVFRSIIQDNSNGSIYYFLLSIIIKTFGYNLVLLRSLSVFLAGINLYMVYLIAGKLQNRVLFQWTALVMTAANPVFLINTLLVRSYMLALLGCLLSIYFLLKILSEEKPVKSSIIFYFLSVLLAAGSHYYTFYILGAEFIFITWHWRKKSSQQLVFMWGYLIMIFLAAGWFYLAYPVSWRNLHFLINDYKHLANLDPGYLFSFKNLGLQWFNMTTYFFGISTDTFGEGRIILKCITTVLFLLMMFKLLKMKKLPQQTLLLFLIVFFMLFYSLHSMLTGQLMNFIPKYLLFMIPLVILGISLVLSKLADEKFKPVY